MKLAFTGISGSGKDYLVSHLIKTHQFHRISFSDQLKKLAVKIYPWLELDYEPIVKETPLNKTLSSGEIITKTPREIWLSLNSLRDIEEGLFVRMLSEEMDTLNADKYVISDIRTQIEWDWCESNGFKTVYIEPLKKIYEPNDFDRSLLEYKGKADYVFENGFDGIDQFEKFVKEIV